LTGTVVASEKATPGLRDVTVSHASAHWPACGLAFDAFDDTPIDIRRGGLGAEAVDIWFNHAA
jgi:hypothetical protein